MKKTLFFICALACALTFSSCGKKDAASSLTDSAKEVSKEKVEFDEANAVKLTKDMDPKSVALGASVSGFACRVCSCPAYCGVYQGYYPSCARCGHAYGMH